MMVILLAEVARTYVDIRQYQAQLDTAEATIVANKNTLAIAQQRLAAGDTPGLDVTQAQAQLEQTESQLPQYQNLLAQAEYSMDVLLGEQPGATHTLTAKSAPIPTSDKKLVLAAPASIIANRPDIRVAERKLASATAQQGVAVAKFFPDISLSGFIGLLNTNAGNLLTAGSQSWMMGASVLWPILSYGTLSANLDAANAQQQEALATYQKSIIAALSDVEKSVTAWTEQDKLQQALAKTTASDRHALDVSRQRYKEGLTSFLEVLDAERTLNASQIQLTEARAQTAQNLIAVYKSLGGGWTASAANGASDLQPR
jgi:NodT family efflux transporter outer membrane factor (OMF) lipoprotein